MAQLLRIKNALVRIPVAGKVCAYALDPHEVWKGYNTTKTMQRLSLKHWSTKTVIFSAESWPCFQIEPAAGGQSGLRVNVLTMIVYPALLFCRLKIPCVFLPRSQERPRRHGSGSALSATGNRLGRTPDPIAVTPTVYDHQPAE